MEHIIERYRNKQIKKKKINKGIVSFCPLNNIGIIEFLSDGRTYSEDWTLRAISSTESEKLKLKDSQHPNIYHREDGPAIFRARRDGTIKLIAWYHDGKYHRIGGPARVEYHTNEQPLKEEWYCNNNRHRIDGPAIVVYSKEGRILNEFYYINGVPQRNDFGPIAISWNYQGYVDSVKWRSSGTDVNLDTYRVFCKKMKVSYYYKEWDDDTKLTFKMMYG